MTDSTHMTPDKADKSIHTGTTKNTEIDLFIVLGDGYTVSQSLYDRIRKQIGKVTVKMVPGRRYTLKNLCGKEFWNPLTTSERIAAGRLMAYLVQEKLVPLAFAGRTRENSQQYWLN